MASDFLAIGLTTTTKMEWSVTLDTMDHNHFHSNYEEIRQLFDT